MCSTTYFLASIVMLDPAQRATIFFFVWPFFVEWVMLPPPLQMTLFLQQTKESEGLSISSWFVNCMLLIQLVWRKPIAFSCLRHCSIRTLKTKIFRPKYSLLWEMEYYHIKIITELEPGYLFWKLSILLMTVVLETTHLAQN